MIDGVSIAAAELGAGWSWISKISNRTLRLSLFKADDPAAIVREVAARLEDVALTLPVVPVGIGDPPRPIVPMVSTDVGDIYAETACGYPQVFYT